jgi:hypothetical protein
MSTALRVCGVVLMVAGTASAGCTDSSGPAVEPIPIEPVPVEPVPSVRITEIQPAIFWVGPHAEVTVHGTGFVPGSVVRWDGLVLETQPAPDAVPAGALAGQSALRARVDLERIDHERITATQQVEVSVHTPAAAVAAVQLPVRYLSPSCGLQDPAYIPTGSGDVQLTCDGGAFTPATKLHVGDASLPGVRIAQNRMRFTLPAALFAGVERIEYRLANPHAPGEPRVLHVVEPVHIDGTAGERLGSGCIIDAAAALQCWDGAPRDVAPGHRFSRISGWCAETLQGEIYCWGGNHSGQLGAGYASSEVPAPGVRVIADTPLRQVAAGAVHACALDTAGYAWCWGSNDGGALGSTEAGDACWGPIPCSLRPVQVSGGHRFVRLAAGLKGTCGLTDAGALYCWGAAKPGRVAMPDHPDNHIPETVAPGSVFEDVTVGRERVCALTTDGDVYCWGRFAQSMELAIAPTRIAGLPRLLRLSRISDVGICGIGESGAAWCWQGVGASGHVPVNAASPWTELVASWRFVCGLTEGGGFYCWPRADFDIPLPVPFPLVFDGWPCGYKGSMRCFDGPTPVLGIAGYAFWR